MKHVLSLSALLLLAACGEPSETTEATEAAEAEEVASIPAEGMAAPEHTASLEVFVMSKCPYGVEVENALVPVKDKLGSALDIQIYYIGGGTPGALTSMHGAEEVKGDIAQLCAGVQMPEGNLDFIACQNQNPREVATNWDACGEQLGLDTKALAECIDGDDGQKLLADSFAEASRRRATGSPTIFLDGQPYAGGRRTNDFMRMICATYGDESPAACADIPPPVAVEAIFLSDERCAECDLHGLEPKLKGALPGLKPRYVDYNSEEGQAIYEAAQAAEPDFGMLPAVLLDSSVEKDEDGHRALARYLRPVGGYIELRLGGKFDPTAEICDNGIDDDGNGTVDCGDPGCEVSMLCRPTIEKKIDLFVMSQCPYGAKALIATNDAVKAFGDDMKVEVHFIGGEKGGALSSMHGQSEVDYDLKEICAQKHAPRTFLAFDACISKNYKSPDWEACATEAGISPATIESCVAGEGPELLRASFQESAKLGIGSSPTYMANNKRIFRAGSAADIQREFCKDNPGLSACSAPIATDAAASAPVPAGECGG